MAKITISQVGRSFFDYLRVPRAPEALSNFDADTIEQLLRMEILSEVGDTSQPIDYYENFTNWQSQRGMLADTRRTEAFRKAIEKTVQRDGTVIDVGAGSGILSMFAARAGASKVYALEMTDVVKLASTIAKRNGLHAIEFIQGDAGHFEAPAPVDLIVAEFAGMYLIDEWLHFAAFANVRDRNLSQSGQVIPRSGAMYLAAIDSHAFYAEKGFGLWEKPLYGFDFSDVLASEIKSPRREIIHLFKDKSIVDSVLVKSFDYRTATLTDYLFEEELEFTYATDGFCHGFVGYFELELTEGQFLSTAPDEGVTTWHQSYFAMPKIIVRAGEKLRLQFRTFVNAATGELCVGLRYKGKTSALEAPEHIYVIDKVT